MRVLVTGGAGFIGSHLVDTLLEQNHEVVVLDNLSTGKVKNLEKAKSFGKRFFFQQGDICSSLDDLFKKHSFETVFHLAAQANVQESIRNPLFDAQTNILGTINLLKAAVSSGVQRFVFTSSVAIYGEPQYLPVDEEHPQKPLSPYGVSKKVAQSYLSYFKREREFQTDVLVLANVYGPRQDPLGEGGVVAVFASKMAHQEGPVIFGSGEQTRDFVYVEDVARALISCLKEKGDGSVYNIGTGRETSVNQLYNMLKNLTGFSQAASHEAERPGEIKAISVSTERALKGLGWTAEISIEEGLKQTVQWCKASI